VIRSERRRSGGAAVGLELEEAFTLGRMLGETISAASRSLPSWLVRVAEPDAPPPGAGDPPFARWRAPAPSGEPTVALDLWASDGAYRVSAAEGGGRVVLVIRHPACACGGGDEAERLLARFTSRGAGVLEELRGEAVLLVWDAADRSLHAARAVGSSRPLYFAAAGQQLVLADQVEALLDRGGVPRQLNRELLACHLADRWHRADETFFIGVSRVPPAHALRWRHGEATLWQHWDPLPLGQKVEWIDREVPEQFQLLFEQAVARALGTGRSGIFLSGGLDSMSVAATAADLARSGGGEGPLALSLAMPHPECDEREIQAAVAAGLGLEQEFLDFERALAGRGLIGTALELSSGWPAPLQNFWLAAYLPLAALGASRGCRVLLTGNGGDEWLGVSPFLSADYLRRLQLLRWARLWRVQASSYRVSGPRLLLNHVWSFGLRPLVTRAAWSAVGAVAPQARRAWREHRRRLPGWLAPDPGLRRALMEREEAAWAAADGSPPEDEYVRHCREPIAHPLVALELDEIAEHGRRTGTLLREPYFDPDLVAFLAQVRPEQLVRGGRSKGLVRGELERRCPNLGLAKQRKVLGTALFAERMQQEAGSLWRAAGGPRALGRMGIIAENEIELLRADRERGGADPRSAYRVWSVLSAEAWVRARG
jgi:asparagine synthase (glutamine-hydrolysing)